MKNKRIFKDFQVSKMSLNIYTSPLLAFAFVFIGEFVAYTLYGISLLALIGLARNFGEAGQAFAAYLQTLQQSLMDKTSDFHLILDLLAFGFMCLPLPTKTSTCKWSVFSPCFISVVSAAISNVWSIDFGLKVLRARAANF